MKKCFAIFFALLCCVLARGQEYTGMLPEYGSYPFYEEEPEVSRERFTSEYLYAPLQAYPDPFAALSEFNFSFLRYRPRGYAFRQQTITLNGIDLGDELTGNKPWSLLRALNDSPYAFTRSGMLTSADNAPGLLAGVRDYRIGAGERPRSIGGSFMFTDRRFRGGTRVNAATGWGESGWAGALSASRRWGRDRHVRGVFADDITATLSAEKRWGDRHRVSLTALGAMTEQGVRGATPREVFDLTDDPFYNPNWGYQDGRERTARVRRNRHAMALATWMFKPSDRLTVTASLAFLYGMSAYSALDRYEAQNPYPDYYRYLPGAIDNPEVADAVRDAWQAGDARITQVDWDGLYTANSGAGSAAYAVSSELAMDSNWQLVSSFAYHRPGQFRLTGGIRARLEHQRRTRRLDDLLGASYLLDIDQYLIDDEYFGDKLQNDLNNPDRRVTEGDCYSFDYDLHHRYAGAWLKAETAGSVGGFGDTRLRGYVLTQAAWRQYFRVGRYEKELFPGAASYGRSETISFTDYLLKGGIGYAFSPSHHLSLDVAYGDLAPVALDVFLSPDYQNRLIENPPPETMLAGEVGWRFRRRFLDLTLSGYATVSRNGTEVRGYYDDLAGAFANLVMTDVDRLQAGVEVGMRFTLSPRWSAGLAGAVANHQYLSDPLADIYDDKSGDLIAGQQRAYLKGYYVGGSPQYLSSGELRYAGRSWMASVSVNWAGGNYVTLNPVRRMLRVCDLAAAPEIREAFLHQERLGDATTIDLFASKTFWVWGGSIILSGAVNNLANRKTMIYSGYEPWRIARTGSGVNRTVTPFDSRYLHAYGRTYYLTLTLRF